MLEELLCCPVSYREDLRADLESHSVRNAIDLGAPLVDVKGSEHEAPLATVHTKVPHQVGDNQWQPNVQPRTHCHEKRPTQATKIRSRQTARRPLAFILARLLSP